MTSDAPLRAADERARPAFEEAIRRYRVASVDTVLYRQIVQAQREAFEAGAAWQRAQARAEETP